MGRMLAKRMSPLHLWS